MCMCVCECVCHATIVISSLSLSLSLNRPTDLAVFLTLVLSTNTSYCMSGSTMWLPCLRFVFVSLLALMPSVLSVVLLWYFEALDQGGPLVLMLLVPALGWYVIHMIRITQNHGQFAQRSAQSDPPPKYEKVMAEPPPYEVLYLEKPSLAKCSCSGGSPVPLSEEQVWDKRKWETALLGYDFCGRDSASGSVPTTTEPKSHHHKPNTLASASVRMEEEALIPEGGQDLQSVVTLVASDTDEGEEGRHDPDLPTYQEAVRIGYSAA
ncbi:uncharacterized protein [Macrobrachium rosenbergii]|uniref:uncharacterized protein n=1 Tax=Macrobrachium rosenbergii TaxID=79674 RepID=UPI0034D58399